MKPRFASPRLGLAAFFPLALCGGGAWAAYDCSVAATSAGAIYAAGIKDNAYGTVILTCSRAVGDANSLTYRIKADLGLNASGTQRRARRGASPDYLGYVLSRGTIAGGGASCGPASNWFAPAAGTADVITGTLNFGAALTASATWGYCIGLPNQGRPAAGIYTDTISVFAQYPNSDAGALTVPAFLNYTVGVEAQCVFNTFPSTMAFNYASFSPVPQVASQSFVLRCSDKLPWSVSVDPPASNLLGLDYSIAASPASGTGNGNIGQTITLTGTIPAGQAGTCTTGTCTASRPHTVIISY